MVRYMWMGPTAKFFQESTHFPNQSQPVGRLVSRRKLINFPSPIKLRKEFFLSEDDFVKIYAID